MEKWSGKNGNRCRWKNCSRYARMEKNDCARHDEIEENNCARYDEIEENYRISRHESENLTLEDRKRGCRSEICSCR